MAPADNGRAEPKSERLDAAVAARGRTDDLVEVESKEAILQERARAFDGHAEASPIVGRKLKPKDGRSFRLS